MTSEKMTVHKALCELKTIGKRIDSAVMSGTYVLSAKRGIEKVKGVPVEDFKTRMKADLQSVEDLIKRRDAIKRAVIVSNARTEVDICGRKYTVAEAIDMSSSGISYYRELVMQLKNQLSRNLTNVENYSGQALEAAADAYIKNILGTQQAAQKIDPKVVESLRAEWIKNNVVDMIDPNDVSNKIKELETFIDSFETEVDSALSVSNALTVIEIEY